MTTYIEAQMYIGTAVLRLTNYFHESADRQCTYHYDLITYGADYSRDQLHTAIEAKSDAVTR